MTANALGINAFSGPMGEKEPAYGVGETMKVLSKIGVKPSPGTNAPRRSQRAAMRKTRVASNAATQPSIPAEGAPVASYDQQLVQFWTQLASTPGASPAVQQLAQKALAGAQ